MGVMKFTLAIHSHHDLNSLEFGLGCEVFLLGQQRALAALKQWESNSTIDKSQPYARLELVHIHAARDHLVLIDPQQLTIEPEESLQLYEAVRPIVSEISDSVNLESPSEWLIKADKFESLITASSSLAIGRNIDHWIPKDGHIVGVARKWRQWQNDIQMLWFDHPVNQRRIERGALPINSVWISGIGALNQIQPHSTIMQAPQIYTDSKSLRLLCNLYQLDCSERFSRQTRFSFLHLNNPNTSIVWDRICRGLIDRVIHSIELIDFPEGQIRIRSIHKEDLISRRLLLLKKYEIPSLHELILQNRRND